MHDAPQTLKDVSYQGDNFTFLHTQDTGLINYHTQLIKEDTDRGFSEGRHFQLAFRIPALDQIKLIKQHPELKDPKLMEKWVFSHDECAAWRIADNRRISGHGVQLIIR